MRFLRRAMKDSFPLAIVYIRGAHSVPITAWTGNTVFASQMDGKARVEFGEVDLQIEAADLVLDGIATKPARGDRCTRLLDDGVTTITLELMVTQIGEPPWRYSGTDYKQYRTHWKRVA